MLFEETHKTLLCSDLFHQVGNVEPLTTSDVVGRSAAAMKAYQAGVLTDYAPYTHYTARLFDKLAELKPERLAIMHGSSFEETVSARCGISPLHSRRSSAGRR